jgi:ubiquinone/menaquinone biosynthesis C-methylase UbiE
MRATYRKRGVKEYWTARWDQISVDAPMENEGVYPLKYAQMTVADKTGKILEAGCGAGRILRYYHNRGYDIVGIDFIEGVVNKLRNVDPTLKADVGDITHLRFADSEFRYVLAYGLFHNLQEGLDQAVRETFRVLEPGGKVCVSFRADNIQTRLTDWLADRKSKNRTDKAAALAFHKMNLTRGEFQDLFSRAGFAIEYIDNVENMPIFYKFRIFRAAGHKEFDETKGRAEGYQLSWLGQRVQSLLMALFPDQFCNIYVIIARRPR